MFTGIIECTGTIQSIRNQGSNRTFTIHSPISSELKVDQSVSHNGVCLTIETKENNLHTVSAVKETLDKSNLRDAMVGDEINLERCVQINGRMDGHFVQGHVDDVGQCKKIIDQNGSWEIFFDFDKQHAPLIVSKGSIAVNGVSLTVVDPGLNNFHVAIIPYTFENTNFKKLKEGDYVNLEFDLLGKYLLRKMQLEQPKEPLI